MHGFVFVKQDAGSAVCVYKRERGEPCAAAPRLLWLQRHHPTIPASSQASRLVFCKDPWAGLGEGLVERSIPFLCGEVVLGNYKDHVSKLVFHELAKTSHFPLGFFFVVSCCSFSGYFPD